MYIQKTVLQKKTEKIYRNTDKHRLLIITLIILYE